MNLEKAAAIVREFEGLRLKAYYCPAGKLTIGYGHTLGVKEGDTCTKEQAEEWLLEDLQKAADAVRKYVVVTLVENQINALASFIFNVGAGNFRESTLLKNLNRGWYDTIGQELMRWVYAKGEILGGLSRRRAAEAALFNKGD